MSSRVWQIEALKFDRRLHYTLPAHLLDDDGTHLWFRAQSGGLIDHITRGKQFTIRHPSDMIFWRERWYNVYVNYTDDGELSHFYCNVGLPPELSGRTLRFVDLDLDVQIWPDGRYSVLDEEEFASMPRCSATRSRRSRPRARPWRTSWPAGGLAYRRSTGPGPFSWCPAGRPACPSGFRADRDRLPTDRRYTRR